MTGRKLDRDEPVSLRSSTVGLTTDRDRRQAPRVDVRAAPLCILQTLPAALASEDAADGWLHAFVDVKNYSKSGVLVDLPVRLRQGDVVWVSILAPAAESWSSAPAHVVWSGTDDAGDRFLTGLEYVSEESVQHVLSSWDTGFISPGDASFLLQTRFFAAIPQESQGPLLRAFRREEVRAGARVIAQGEPGERLYVIQEGACLVLVEREGQLHRDERLLAGDVFGEMSVLTGEPRSAHVDAESDAVLWRLERRDCDRLVEHYPDLRRLLTGLMTHRFERSVWVAERLVGKYVLRDRIGSGGWGIVYRGTHKLLKMPVAIKMMKHDMALDPGYLELVRREAETVAGLTHPNIVQVYDIEEVYKTIFIIMERLDGVSLKVLLDRVGVLPVERCIDILLQVCDGLAAAHKRGIVHRDVKPANVFVLDDDRVKLLDFGVARPQGAEVQGFAGTLWYAPLEQLEGRPADRRSDIYSVGVMAYEMATGDRPQGRQSLSALMRARRKGQFPDPARIVRDVPQPLRAFISRCCQPEPEKRFPSIHAARDAIKPRAQQSTAAASPKLSESGVTSLLLIHEAAQQPAVRSLLEELGGRARGLGIDLRVTGFTRL